MATTKELATKVLCYDYKRVAYNSSHGESRNRSMSDCKKCPGCQPNMVLLGSDEYISDHESHCISIILSRFDLCGNLNHLVTEAS